MNLTVLADLQAEVFVVVQHLARHDSFRANTVGYSASCREEVQHSNTVEDDMNRQQFGNSLERKIVSTCSTTFLDNANSPFDFSYMFVGARQVDNGTARH